MEDLKQWLDNPTRDYYVGVKLYEKYGDDLRLKIRVFPSGPMISNQKILQYELQKVYDGSAKNVKNKAPESKPIQAVAEEKPADQTEEKPQTRVPIPESTEGFLRKEFPKIQFGSLPNELKILVVDRIALYHAANAAREAKFEAISDEERLKLNTEEIQSRIKNDEIWAELNHYQETGEILGKHPLFERYRFAEKLKGLTKESLIKMKKNFPPSVSKVKKAIREAGDNAELVLKKNALLEKYEWQEKEVDRMLGL